MYHSCKMCTSFMCVRFMGGPYVLQPRMQNGKNRNLETCPYPLLLLVTFKSVHFCVRRYFDKIILNSEEDIPSAVECAEHLAVG